MADEPRPSLPASSRRLVPIGTKLAAATALLMLVVTAGVYVNLTAYQRESLLRAKEMSAAAVTRLFANSCAAAVVFDDQESLDAELKTLGNDPDVEYAALEYVGRTRSTACALPAGKATMQKTRIVS